MRSRIRPIVEALMISILLLAPLHADAVISDGAAAIDLLGQYDDNLTSPSPIYTKSTANDGPNKLGLSSPGYGVVVDWTNRRLYVPESGNHRILMYNLTSTGAFVDRIPDAVLGQSNFYSNSATNSAAGLNFPTYLAFDGTDRLFVSQQNNHRVSVFDIGSVSNGEDAVNVLGQQDFISFSAANTQAGMNTPYGLAYDSANNRLFVAQNNHRVTAYDVASITNGENATHVIGQSDFTSFSAANTQAGMNSPRGIAYDSTNSRLFVAQNGSRRVTVYNMADGITDGESAVNVLGQSTFTAFTAANTQAGMNGPLGVAVDEINNLIYVAQNGSRRVTVYSGATLANGMNAAKVLGQSTFTAFAAANTQAGMNGPIGVSYDPNSQRLYVGQSGNHSVRVFDVSSITNGESAVDLLGHYDDNLTNPQPIYTKAAANNGPNKRGFSLASSPISNGILIDATNHRLFFSDYDNSRVLMYNLDTDNTLDDRIPDAVLGQANFYSNTSATTQTGLTPPAGLAYDASGNRLFVVDNASNRVLVYDAATITNGEAAQKVLGQSNFTSLSGVTTAGGMLSPISVIYDDANSRLYVSQSGSNRVTVYDVASITDGEDAVNVLGQANFTSSTADNTQSTMNQPLGLAHDVSGNRLFVSNNGNHRVLVYDVSTLTDGENAINVLGQSDFTSFAAANTQEGMNSPSGLAYDAEDDRLFVAQTLAHRVLVYDVASVTDGQHAVNVLGQSTFTSVTAANTQAGLKSPQGIAYDADNGYLYVAQMNNRISVFDAALTAPASSSSSSSSSSAAAQSSAPATEGVAAARGGRRGSDAANAARIAAAAMRRKGATSSARVSSRGTSARRSVMSSARSASSARSRVRLSLRERREARKCARRPASCKGMSASSLRPSSR